MDYRNYDDCNSNVKQLYQNQRMNQNLDYVKKCIKKYCSFTKKDKFVDLFEKISLKDLSDPDLDCVNCIPGWAGNRCNEEGDFVHMDVQNNLLNVYSNMELPKKSTIDAINSYDLVSPTVQNNLIDLCDPS